MNKIEIGQEYPKGMRFYVKSTQSWFNSDDCSKNPDGSRYRREADELPEPDANEQGFYFCPNCKQDAGPDGTTEYNGIEMCEGCLYTADLHSHDDPHGKGWSYE